MKDIKYTKEELQQKIRLQFNRMESDVKKNKMNLEMSEFESAFVSRRKDILEKYMPAVLEKTEGLTTNSSEVFSRTDIFIFLNSLPNLSYADLQFKFDIIFAASIWVSDVLKEYNLIEQANQCMPNYHDVDVEQLMGQFFDDSTHSNETLETIAYILARRNKDCAGYRKKNGINRVLLDEFTARNKHRQDVPSRHYFENLIQLLPKEKIEEAVSRFETKFWQFIILYFQSLDVYGEKLNSIDDKKKKLISLMEKYQKEFDVRFDLKGKKKGSPLLHQKDNPFIGSMMNLLQGEEITPSNMEKIYAYARDIDDLQYEEEKIEDEIHWFNENIPAFSYECDNTLKEQFNSKVIDIMKQMTIDDPYEICFAFLYMIDQGNDLIWLYYPCYTLMQIAGLKLPWNVDEKTELTDRIWNLQDAEETRNLSGSEKELVSELCMDLHEETEEKVNMAQILYALTGLAGPRNISYYHPYRIALDQYDLTAEQKNFLFGMIVMGAEKLNKPKNIHFQISLENFFGSSEEKEDEEKGSVISTKEMESLKREIDSLRSSLYRAEKETKELKKKLNDLQEETRNEHQELADLRELVFIQGNNIEQKANMQIQFPYEVKKKTVVFGGHDAWLKQMKELLVGNIRFIVDLKVSADVIRNADIIWLQTDCISHNKYYWVIDTCKKNNTPFRIFPSRHFRTCAERIYGFDKK